MAAAGYPGASGSAAGAADASPLSPVAKGPAGKVVVLVGMRGAGKTSLGKMVAAELKREFVDLDEVFEKVFSCTVTEFVAKHGWEKFREEETQVLKDSVLLGKHGAGAENGAVVACGGGVIETPAAMSILEDFFPVVWVNKHIDDITTYLESAGAWRPSLGASPKEVFARRRPLYDKCSDYIFTIRKGDDSHPEVSKDFVSCVRWAVGAPTRVLEFVPDAFIRSLPFPDVGEALAKPGTLSDLTKGIDLLEVRVDLMKNPTDEAWLLEELALLRRHVFTPLCFTLRHEALGGKFAGSSEQALQLLKLGLRAGCEVVEVDKSPIIAARAGCFRQEQLAELLAIKHDALFVRASDRGTEKTPFCTENLSLLEPSKSFYIFGDPVAMSASPVMQNCGFKANGKPHVYKRYQTPSVQEVAWKLSLTKTGGGSVTIPHKETLFPYMDGVSESARVIGAINTVTKDFTNNRLHGDNTDWLGIKNQLLPKIKHREGDQVGLIIGAGGTARAAAYAFRSMGLKKIYVMNRTYARAVEIVNDFGDSFEAVQDAATLGELTRLDAIMGTLPGQAGFTLPQELLDKHKPAVIEAAYASSASGSRFTPLLQQSVKAGCEIVEGLEMLFEQGCAQCEIWTNKKAPRRQIAQALLDDRFANDPSPPSNLVREAALKA